MAPSKAPDSWQDEESDSGSSSAPSPQVLPRRSKFADEEEDSDVLDSWEAAEDSEVEREKTKKVAEAKAKAEAEAKANQKSKAQRIEEKRQETLRRRQLLEEEESSDEETEAERRERVRESEKASDLKHAEDLFGDIADSRGAVKPVKQSDDIFGGVGGVPASRGAPKAITVQEGDDPANAVYLSKMKLFTPTTIQGFNKLRDTLVPLVCANSKKPQYESFVKEFSKQIAQGLNSDQIKKIASGLTTLSNEKMREEKAAEKGGKKSKAAKTKTTLSAARDISSRVDTTLYDDGLDEDDFM